MFFLEESRPIKKIIGCLNRSKSDGTRHLCAKFGCFQPEALGAAAKNESERRRWVKLFFYAASFHFMIRSLLGGSLGTMVQRGWHSGENK